MATNPTHALILDKQYDLTPQELYVTGISSNTNYPLVFTGAIGSSTSGSSSLQKLYTDTANSVYYNPYSNILTAPIFSGTHQGTIYQSDLAWGRAGISNSVTPVGMSLSADHSANRLAFLNPKAVKIEYSNNSGSSYTDSGITDVNKINLVTTSAAVIIGQSGTVATTGRTRITLGANGTGTSYEAQYIYTRPKKMLINITTNGHGVSVDIEYAKGNAATTWTKVGTYVLEGWSGWNDIPLELAQFGGSSGQTSNIWYLRLTFNITAKGSTSGYDSRNPQVLGIRLFGDTIWYGSNEMAKTGRLYTFDSSQNATFPGNVSVASGKKFIGTLNGTATTATELSSKPSLGISGTNITVTAGGKTSDAFTVPYATQALNDGDGNKISTTYFKVADKDSFKSTIKNEIIDSAPGTLDTLNELAAALNDDANFASTITNSINARIPKSDLLSETKGTKAAAAMGNTDNRQYAVGYDVNGKLSVNVPWSNSDTKVTQTVTNTSNTSWRPLLLGSSYSDADLFAPSTTTDTTYASHLIKVRPSTGDLCLYSPSGDSPHLIFQRAGSMDGTYDWDMYCTSGIFKIRRNNAGTWSDALSFYVDSTDKISTSWPIHSSGGFVGYLTGNVNGDITGSAAKLSTVSKTAWGQTYWTSGGVPTSISGSIKSTNFNIEDRATNPYYQLIENDKNCYLQIVSGNICLGSTSTKSLSITQEGAVSMPSTLNVTGTITGNLDGNATSADNLKTARNIKLIGSVTGNANFDGSRNIEISTTTNHSHAWATNTNAIVHGNEFNIGNSTESLNRFWFNYRGKDDNTFADNNLINEYLMGSGNGGHTTTANKYAFVTARGFKVGGQESNKYVVWSNGTTSALAASDIPNLDASKITSGIFDAARIPGISMLDEFDDFSIYVEQQLCNKYDSTTNRTANTVLAAPNGSTGVATFRTLVAADIPALAASKITSGTFAIERIPVGTSLKLYTSSSTSCPVVFANNIGSSTGTACTLCSESDLVYNSSNNTLSCKGGFYETSDERLKEIIRPLHVNLEKLSKLRKVYFTWKDNPRFGSHKNIGMIAQDVKELYPELITEQNGRLSLAYDKLSVIALEAIDILYKENKELKEQLNNLENKCFDLEEKLIDLEVLIKKLVKNNK